MMMSKSWILKIDASPVFKESKADVLTATTTRMMMMTAREGLDVAAGGVYVLQSR